MYVTTAQEQVLRLNYMLNWTRQWISLGHLTLLVLFPIWFTGASIFGYFREIENNASLPVVTMMLIFFFAAAGFLFEWMQMAHVVCVHWIVELGSVGIVFKYI